MGLEKQKRLEAKRLIRKLFKNVGVGVIRLGKSHIQEIFFFFNDIELTDLGKQ